MNNITIFLIFILIILLFAAITYFSLKAYFKSKKKIKELEQMIENQKKNLIYIVRHSQELAEIDKSRSKVDKEISEAKSDEEVINIINTIIDINNNRLPDNSKK